MCANAWPAGSGRRGTAGRRLTRSAAASIANAVIEETFRVFADYMP